MIALAHMLPFSFHKHILRRCFHWRCS
uniref:Uncharacterized protein n=1 Tax=Arundo donax TaxID=35708 RepID=A0A0A9TRI9_ARUDO